MNDGLAAIMGTGDGVGRYVGVGRGDGVGDSVGEATTVTTGGTNATGCPQASAARVPSIASRPVSPGDTPLSVHLNIHTS